MAAHTYKGNNTGSTANPIDVTNTQLTADLNQFTTTLQGLVSASGGGTTKFLRADNTWVVPIVWSAGSVALSATNTSKAVTFGTAFANTNYQVTAQLVNITDTNVQFMPITITAKSTTGFTASWPDAIENANYTLSYMATANN